MRALRNGKGDCRLATLPISFGRPLAVPSVGFQEKAGAWANEALVGHILIPG